LPKNKKIKKTFSKSYFWQDFCMLINIMKMTGNISSKPNYPEKNTNGFQEKIAQIISNKWKLKSILETGIVTDEADFQDVEVVFSEYHIYALYGNRVDKFKYKFLSAKTFVVNIENVDVKCRIKEISDEKFIFHVDFKNSHFIVELEKD